MRRERLVQAALLIVISSAGWAQEPTEGAPRNHQTSAPLPRQTVTETRTHFVIAAATGSKIGEATRVVRGSADVDRDYVLYRSVDGDQFVLESTMSYATHSSEKVIRTVKGDAWVTSRYKLPFAGRTRDDFFAEARRNPELWDMTGEQTELATNGGSFRVTDSEYSPPHRGEVARRLRQVIPFDLLEMIERGVSTIFATELATFQRLQIVNFAVYHPHCAAEPPTVTQTVPDCGFDKQFGFACSEKQLVRVKQARQESTAPAY